MSLNKYALSAVFCVLTAMMVSAQTAPAPEAQPEPVPEVYTKQTDGDWEVRCLRVASGEEPCQMFQRLFAEGGNPIAEITLFKLPQGNEAAIGASIIVPLETLLPPGLELVAVAGLAKTYPFGFCTDAGCVARVGFTAQEVEQMRKGDKASMRILSAAAPDTPVAIDISLKGFSAAYDALPVNKE